MFNNPADWEERIFKNCTRYPQGNQGVERIKCLSERRYKEIKRVKKEKIKIKRTPFVL
jgi:hypothetical protein